MSNPALYEATAAAIELNFNLLVILTIVSIIKQEYEQVRTNNFSIVLDHIMEFFFRPMRHVVGKFSPNKDITPYVFIALIIPMQIVLVATLRL